MGVDLVVDVEFIHGLFKVGMGNVDFRQLVGFSSERISFYFIGFDDVRNL